MTYAIRLTLPNPALQSHNHRFPAGSVQPEVYPPDVRFRACLTRHRRRINAIRKFMDAILRLSTLPHCDLRRYCINCDCSCVVERVCWVAFGYCITFGCGGRRLWQGRGEVGSGEQAKQEFHIQLHSWGLNRPGFEGGSPSLRRWSHDEEIDEVFPEVRERAVRLVFESRGDHGSQWAAIEAIAPKIGCSTQTLCNWVRQYERDTGQRDGVATAEADRIKQLERRTAN